MQLWSALASGGHVLQEGALVLGNVECLIAPGGAEPEVISHLVARQTGDMTGHDDAVLELPVHQNLPRLPRVPGLGDDGDLEIDVLDGNIPAGSCNKPLRSRYRVARVLHRCQVQNAKVLSVDSLAVGSRVVYGCVCAVLISSRAKRT